MKQPVLVVGTQQGHLADRVDALARAGYHPIAVASFSGARAVLEEVEPEALITEVHLGDYNGLHLVAIARIERPKTNAIVIGPRDPALQADANHLGARYLVEPVRDERLVEVVAELVATPRPQRRWPRKRPAQEIETVVSGRHGRLLDVSYGGAGVELFDGDVPDDRFELVVPGYNVAVPVERVWARRTAQAMPVACGLALRRDGAVDASWREFVDLLDIDLGSFSGSGAMLPA